MKEQRIFIDPQYGWTSLQEDNNKCHVKGWFRHNGKVFKKQEAAKKLISFLAKEMATKTISRIIKELQGNFAFILETPAHILASVDEIRSYPVFHTDRDHGFYVSNSARLLRKEKELYEREPDSLIEFEMSGYVTGPYTLFKGLQQLQAGECIYHNHGESKSEIVRYYVFYSREQNEKTKQELIDELDASTTKTFKEMIETLNGRPVWVPLSGGLDSRLIVAMLVHLGYRDITTFSYGLPGNCEARAAEKISRFLNIRWVWVPYQPKLTCKMFHSERRKSYFKFADGLCSVPFLNDFFALWSMRERRQIPDDAIIINGQSGDFITGGHIPSTLINSDNSLETVWESIASKHYSLWEDIKTKKNEKCIREKFKTFFNLCGLGPQLTIQQAASIYEWWEWQERQAKFVCNGQQVYDFLGYEWRLPLWSNHYLYFWSRVDWENKFGQKLFKNFLIEKDYCHLFAREWCRRYNSPRYMIGFAYLLKLYSSLFRSDYQRLVNKLLKYFMSYAPFYSYMTYRAFLKRSRFHRNIISYHVYEVLKGM